MTAQPGGRFTQGLQRRTWGLGGLSIAVAVLAFKAPQASACSWWWACDGPPYADRPPPPAYGYRSPARAYRYRGAPWAYRYRGAPWAYGYTSPERFYGYPYAAWPSTSIPPTRSYLNTATPVPNADAIGLTVPITSAEGLREGGLPLRGPSLFGPQQPPVWGYGYGAPAYGYNGYYGAASYGYRATRPYSYGGPPPDSPSWWVEPRRRR
jgi:hypothetical protein